MKFVNRISTEKLPLFMTVALWILIVLAFSSCKLKTDTQFVVESKDSTNTTEAGLDSCHGYFVYDKEHEFGIGDSVVVVGYFNGAYQFTGIIRATSQAKKDMFLIERTDATMQGDKFLWINEKHLFETPFKAMNQL